MAHPVTIASLMALSLTSLAAGQTLTDLPAGAGGFGGISSDGTFVVGRDNATSGAYIWSSAVGLTPIGENDAVAVSTDGTRVFGEATNGAGESEASLYALGSWTSVGTIPNGSACGSFTSPYDMSNDGLAATGLAWESCKGRAFYWNGSTTIQLPQMGPNSSRGNAVSGDGLFAGGWDESSNGTRRAAIWNITTGIETLPLVGAPGNPAGAGETWGFSTNGRYAVGQWEQPWLYDTQSGELTYLGLLPGASPSDIGIARAVSDDGKTVVGLSGNSFFGTPWRAWIWTKDSGIEVLATYLTNAGVSVPANMYGAIDMSADGRTILGAYANFVGFAGDGWVVKLPPIDALFGGTQGTGGKTPALSATGTVVSGTPFAMYLDDAAANSVSILFVSPFSNPLPLLGGTFWPAPVLASLQPLPTDNNGEWLIGTTWPAGLPSLATITLQALVADPGALGGYALSNGLTITPP